MPEPTLRADVLLVVTEAECLTACLHLLPTSEEHTLQASGTIVWIGSRDCPPFGTVQIALLHANDDGVAALAQEMLTALRPSYTIYLGLAGAVAEPLRIGDVVAAAPLHAIDYGEEGKTFRPHPRSSRPAHRLVQRAQVEANRFDWHQHQYGLQLAGGEQDRPCAHVQPVASGRVLFQRGAEGLKWLRENYADTVAIMRAGEDFSAASAVHHAMMLVLCGISHDLRSATPAIPTARRLSARHCAAFAFALIARLGPAPGGTPREVEPEPPINAVDEHRQRLSDRLEALLVQQQAAQHGSDDDQDQHIEKELQSVRAQLRAGPQLAAGDVLGDRYRLREQIGSGGFATVFHAYDRIERRSVAVKVLHPNLGGREDIRVRFFRGARRMAELGGSGAVRVTDFGGSDRGYHYFAMDLLTGHLRVAVTAGNETLRERLAWIAQIGKTLGAAHDLGIIHRDVRPENILMDARRSARLTDFDIAHIPEGTQYTQSASIGTYRYAAPEQLQNAQIATVRSDIYSLALVTLFVITRVDPDPDALQHDRNGLLGKLSIPASLKLILARALAPRPRDRHYTDANDFCRDLDQCLDAWEAPPDEAAIGSRLGLIAALSRLPELEFEAVVTRIEAEEGGWRCRRGARIPRAIDVLQIAERRSSPTWSRLLRSPRPAQNPERGDESSIPGDWEDIFHWLCALPYDIFAALIYAYELEITAPAHGPLSAVAADVVCNVTLAHEEHHFVDRLRHFSRYITAAPAMCRPPTTLSRLGWTHCKLQLALALLARRRAPAAPDAPSDLSAAFTARDYSGLLRLLGDIQRWKHVPLELARWVGRARVLAAEALELAIAARRTTVACASRMSRLELYHGLCRLRDAAWSDLCAQFVMPCMLPPVASRAEQAMQLLDYLAPYPLDPLQRALAQFEGAGELPPSGSARAERTVYTTVREPPAVLQSEWLLRAEPELQGPVCNLDWPVLQPRLQESDRGWHHYHNMRDELLAVCGIPDHGSLAQAAADEHCHLAGSALDMLRQRHAEDLLTIWDALQIPSWYHPPCETPPDRIADQLVAFLRWLLPADWASVILAANGAPECINRWIRGRRTA